MINPKVLEERKRSIEQRLAGVMVGGSKPMLATSNIHYEMADRTRAISDGGIGLIHKLVQEIGLAELIF